MLKDINLSAGKGRFMGLLGPNGSGKTTLLHCLNRLLIPSGGTITLLGQDIQALGRKALARRISLVVQEHPDIFPFSVLDVVVMGRAPFLGFGREPGPEDYRIAMAELKGLNADHLARESFNRISGGERRLALLAAALVQSRQIVLMDEPTNHLDFKHQYHLLSRIRRLCRDEGATVIAAMHDPHLAMCFTDDIVLLKKGKVLDTGETGRIMTRSNMDRLYDTRTACLALGKEGRFFMPEDHVP